MKKIREHQAYVRPQTEVVTMTTESSIQAGSEIEGNAGAVGDDEGLSAKSNPFIGFSSENSVRKTLWDD
ncbi:MAG: hypothetical protein K6A82_02925 [Prevotella sp.]|nr:hypothetical protein [Prevotella sp.]